MKKAVMIIGIIIAVFIFVLIGIKIVQRSKPVPPVIEETYAIPVIATKVISSDIERSIEYIGEIEPDKTVNVFPKVPGKIIKNYVEEGDYVKTGKMLSTLDRDITGLTYKNVEVTAPSSGFVYMVYADEGNMVSPQAPIFTIYEMDKIKVTFMIPENDFVPDILDKEIYVEIPAAGFRSSELKISKVFPVLDKMTRSFKLQINVKNTDHKIRPGSYAKVKVIYEKHYDVLIVPKDSIFAFEGKEYVYVVNDNKVKKTEIKTGLQENLFLEVLEGLAGTEQIIYKGIYSVKDGDQVKIVKEEILEK